MNKRAMTPAAERRTTRLTGRAALARAFAEEDRMRRPLARLREALAEIRPLWDRLDPEQRATVEAKDAVLQMARQLHDELGAFFDA